MDTVERRTIRSRRTQRGAYSVAFVVFVVVLLGFMGLAVDSGRLYVSKGELQNAADACALAAAAALTGANANQLDQAVAFGQTAGARNRVGMQETAVVVPEASIAFSDRLDGGFQPRGSVGNPLQMRFARCTLTEANVPTFLIHVVNLLPGTPVNAQTVSASAVATNSPSRSNCGIPLAVCKKSDSPGWGLTVGEWISGRERAGGGRGGDTWSGAYRWVQLPGYPQNRDLQELLRGSGQCNLNGSTTLSSYQGVTNNLIDAYNTRFGVYRRNTNASDITTPPDFSGHSYYPQSAPGVEFDGVSDTLPTLPFNQFQNFSTVQRPGNTPWNNVPAWVNGNSSNFVDVDTIRPGSHRAGGDRRLAVAPIVDCGALSGNGANVPILDWACVFLLHPMRDPNRWNFVEYRGSARLADSPCVTAGLPAGPAGNGPLVPALVQ
jgi:Flp pilus assembly protein TadG